MSVSSISSSLVSQLAAGSTATSSSRGQGGAIAVAAKALGMSVDDVTSALKSGSSLADLATKQGVSEDDLVSALTQNAPDDLRSNSNVTQLITTMVEQKGLSGPGDGTPPPPPSSSSDTTGVLSGTLTDDQQSTLSSLADLLGTDSDSLLSSLQSGTSLSDLLENKGVSMDQLAGAVQGSLLLDTTA